MEEFNADESEIEENIRHEEVIQKVLHNNCPNKIIINMIIKKTIVKCQVDTGSTCSVIGLPELDRIFTNPRDINMKTINKNTITVLL